MEKWKKVACKNLVGNLKTTNKKVKLKKRKFRANVLWDWLIWEQVTYIHLSNQNITA